MGWHDDGLLTSIDAGGSDGVSGDQVASDVPTVVHRYGVPRDQEEPRQIAKPTAMETARITAPNVGHTPAPTPQQMETPADLLDRLFPRTKQTRRIKDQ